jgi:hypothetical protein
MRCERHGLAAGPDGRCALCHRPEAVASQAAAHQGDRTARRVAKVVVAVVAGIAVFALLLALFDTRNAAREPPAIGAIDAPARK